MKILDVASVPNERLLSNLSNIAVNGLKYLIENSECWDDNIARYVIYFLNLFIGFLTGGILFGTSIRQFAINSIARILIRKIPLDVYMIFNLNFQLFSNIFFFLSRIQQHFSGKYFYQNQFLIHKEKNLFIQP